MERDGRKGESIGRTVADWNRRVFVGREQELAIFGRLLDGTLGERLLNVHGTVGCGKSFLLEEFGRRAEQAGALYLPLGGGWGFMRSPEAVVQRLGQSLQAAGISASAPAGSVGEIDCIAAINRAAGERKVILAFDHYEQAGAMDGWLREALIPRLQEEVLVILCGRQPLAGPWRLNPGWRQLLCDMPLAEFREEETAELLRRHGVIGEEALRHAMVECRGNPLALSLLLATADPARPPAAGTNEQYIRHLVRHALDDIRDNELLELVRAASIIAYFNEDSLESVLGRPVGGLLFDRLVGLSYVHKTDRGWTMHEVIREAVKEELRLRKPASYKEMAERCAALLLREIGQGVAGPDAAWKTVELMSYADNPLLRAHYRHSRGSSHYVEPLQMSNIEEAERYLIRRRELAKDTVVRCADALTGAVFEYRLSAEETLYRLSGLELRRWMALEPGAVLLLKEPGGEMVGLFVIVPIHLGTIGELRRGPVSQAFFEQADSLLLKMLYVPREESPGWFIRAIDVTDMADDSLRSASVRVTLEYALEGKLLLASPPALDFYRDGHRGLGFEPIPGIVHYDYDGSTPVPTLMIDTRGSRRIDYLRRLLKLSAPDAAFAAGEAGEGAAAARSGPDGAAGRAFAQGLSAPAEFALRPKRPALTEREREVAGLLIEGGTNAEIAAKLYISEAAVKKHLNAMFQKLAVKNRTQLVKTLLEMP
nr:LuxR family transcriptional regulator [Paenibacillus hamazuiensis]